MALCLLSSTALAQNCVLTDRLTANDFGKITEIQNVKAELKPWRAGKQSCSVTLDGQVNGKWAKGKGEFTWDGQSSSTQACLAAVDLAKRDLLNQLSDSTISNQSVVICKEETKKDKPLLNPAVGTVIDNINVLRVHPSFPRSFYHNGEECKWYIENAWNGIDIKHINGIVCRLDTTHWVVVDKF